MSEAAMLPSLRPRSALPIADGVDVVGLEHAAVPRTRQLDVIAAGGDYGVRLKDGTVLSLSRARREELEEKLGSG